MAVLEGDRVIITDSAARAAGIRPGLRRGGVLTLAPETLLFERSEAREEEAARDVATALMQFSPMVVLGEETTILMDVSASLRLFGGALGLCRLVQEVLARFGFTSMMSTAPTGRGAWMLARSGGRTPSRLYEKARTRFERVARRAAAGGAEVRGLVYRPRL